MLIEENRGRLRYSEFGNSPWHLGLADNLVCNVFASYRDRAIVNNFGILNFFLCLYDFGPSVAGRLLDPCDC